MRSIPSKVLASVLVVFACSAVAVASASASEFVFSKTGALKGNALTSQVFGSPAGNWECSKETTSGSVTALKTTTQKATVQYEKCFFFGKLFTVSPAEYELNTNGTVKLVKEFTMKTSGCTIAFPAQTMSTLTYANKPAGKIEITASIKLVSRGVGAVCSYEEAASTLTGRSLLELEGGTAEVK